MPKETRRGGKGKKWSFKVAADLDLTEATRYSLSAAAYHLNGVRHFRERLAADESSNGVTLTESGEDSFRKMNHYFRAFFWELIAASESLLQTINRQLGLELGERDVDWSAVSHELSLSPKYKRFLRALASGFNGPWFSEVREFRNFPHRGTFVLEAVGFAWVGESHSKLRALLVHTNAGGRGMGEPAALCEKYFQHMQEFIHWALDEVGNISTMPD